MSRDGKVNVTLQGHDNVSPVLDEIRKGLDGLKEQAKDSLAELAKGYIGLVSAEKVADFFKESIDAAAQAERAEAQLANTLRLVGASYDDNKDRLEEFAQAQRKSTIFTAEDVNRAMTSVIRTTGSYGEQTLVTTKLAEDLATALGTDLNSAALMISRAYEGNVRQLGLYIPALRTMGAEAIKAMSTEERIAMVNDLVQKSFGGAAQSAGTMTLALAQLSHANEELKEKLGSSEWAADKIRGAANHIENLTAATSAASGAADVARGIYLGMIRDFDASQQHLEKGIHELGQSIGGTAEMYLRGQTALKPFIAVADTFGFSIRDNTNNLVDWAYAFVTHKEKVKEATHEIEHFGQVASRVATDVTRSWTTAWSSVEDWGKKTVKKLEDDEFRARKEAYDRKAREAEEEARKATAAAKKHAEERAKAEASAYADFAAPGENSGDSDLAKKQVEGIHRLLDEEAKATEEAGKRIDKFFADYYARRDKEREADLRDSIKAAQQEEKAKLKALQDEARAEQQTNQYIQGCFSETAAVHGQMTSLVSHYADVWEASEKHKMQIIEAAAAFEAGIQAGLETARAAQCAAVEDYYGAAMHGISAALFSAVATEHAGNAMGFWDTTNAGQDKEGSGSGGGGGGGSSTSALPGNRASQTTGTSSGALVVNNYYPQGHLIWESQAGRQQYLQGRSAKRSGMAR